MAKRKKKNVSARDKQVRDNALTTVWAIFFTVLFDKEGYSVEDMQRVWKECEYLAESVAKGWVKVTDLTMVLENEYNVILKG